MYILTASVCEGEEFERMIEYLSCITIEKVVGERKTINSFLTLFKYIKIFHLKLTSLNERIELQHY